MAVRSTCLTLHNRGSRGLRRSGHNQSQFIETLIARSSCHSTLLAAAKVRYARATPIHAVVQSIADGMKQNAEELMRQPSCRI